uniref:Ycf80 n=1 Tax=Hydropuntia rangiferina TaxID=338881 RepID=A0A345U8A2_9FLOR|nr:hypothetical protein [Hydropuntia rangiferina]AXI96688.1 hypothetical protein [Hydropuntia rangiferina]UAD87371.1 hypothetical protein [Hydropuntia rangiferina]
MNIHLHSFLFAKNRFSSDYNASTFMSNQTFVTRTIVGKLIDNYWQEKIFLSVRNIQSEKYINQLKLEGILIYKTEQKKFLLDFSKALLSGRIEACLSPVKLTSSNNNYVSYIWRKGFNFSIPKRFALFSSNILFLSKKQVSFLKILYQQPFPIFTVTNNLNQIILADSSENTKGNLKTADKIHKWYYTNFIMDRKVPSSYYGLFFIHPADAQEYISYIKKLYNFSDTQTQLNLFSSYLSVYYKLTRMHLQSVQIKLIPDIEELGKLIYKYKYYQNIQFHKHQKYSKNSFQGQPIYIIQPFFAYNKKSKKIKLLHYTYTDKNDQVVFTNYSTLLRAWQKFKCQNSDYKLLNRPKVLVYNLEDLISTYEFNEKMQSKNIFFIPSKESYEFIKNHKYTGNHRKIKQIFSNKLLDFQLISQRLIWSLTSRQPVSW